MSGVFFEKMFNSLYKEDLNLLFGSDSKIIVDSCFLSSNVNRWSISVNLIPTDFDMSMEVYPDGLVVLIEEAWKFTGKDRNIILTTSIKN